MLAQPPNGGTRIALLSDIHGNLIALDAVLADVEQQGGVDSYWILGDLSALGYAPVAVLERLETLPNVRFVRGNTDRYLVSDNRPSPREDDVLRDADKLPKLVEVARSLAWTQGAITVTGWLSWFAQLPLEQRLTLPDGTRLLGVHAAPGQDDGHGIHPGLSDRDLALLAGRSDADLVVVGHTHVPLDWTVAGVRFVNLGSVSNPVTADYRARYALIEATTVGYQLHFRQVDYDRDAVIRAIRESRHPASEFLMQYMRGELLSRWVR